MTYNALKLNLCSYIVYTRLSRMCCPRTHSQHLQLQAAQTNSNHSVPNRLSRRMRSLSSLAGFSRWTLSPDVLAACAPRIVSQYALTGFTRCLLSPQLVCLLIQEGERVVYLPDARVFPTMVVKYTKAVFRCRASRPPLSAWTSYETWTITRVVGRRVYQRFTING
jgi:hypothetical protein